MPIDLFSELQAVNDMLEAIHEQPAETLENTEFSFALQARAKLVKVSQRLQMTGWKCNRTTNLTMNITEDGEIVVPTNTILLEADRRNGTLFDWRGEKFFNPLTNDNIFDVSPIVIITVFLEWDQLPNYLREYITAVSVREFEATNGGDPQLKPDIVARETRAQAEAVRQNVKAHNVNILDLDPAYDVTRRQADEGSSNRWEWAN